jgi:acetamidase/formamidase
MTPFRLFSRPVCVLLLCLCSLATRVAAQPSPGLSGEWLLTSEVYRVKLGERLSLKVDGNAISGSLLREQAVVVEGTLDGAKVHFRFKESDGTQNEYRGEVDGGVLSGEYSSVAPSGERTSGRWSARRFATNPNAGPHTHEYVPREFPREFSSTLAPVLHLWPGDSVRTTTVDAGGTDEHGETRGLGGNPLTGPFYVEGAMPGDVLAVTIKQVRLNRDWAISDMGLVDRATTPGYRADNKPDWSNTRWHLDVARGVASLEKPSERLKTLSVPVRPMLGCVGVAPGFAAAAMGSQDSGYLGGNMDFSLIGEGTTLYLGVNQPGALLYVGDGHALQGDGELNGNALETSMDVEFSVGVLRGKSVGTPRAENKDFLMAIGLAGSLDAAFSRATSELASWLQQDYGLSSADVAALLGVSVQYTISEVADRNVGVVAKVPKTLLGQLPALPGAR